MIEHPPHTWMIGFIRGKLPVRKLKAYIAHLLSGCAECRDEIGPTARVMFHPSRAVEPTKGGAEYDGPIDRAVLNAIERHHERIREIEEAEANLSRFLTSKGGLDLNAWTWGLCEVLLKKSWSFRHENTREMRRFAHFACEAAEHLDLKHYGAAPTLDMRARAWGEYANACRAGNDLVQAEWALQRALALYKQGSGAKILRARLSEVTGGLFAFQRQFQAAFRALDLAYTLYSREGRMHDALRVMIRRGTYTGRSGDPEQALVLLSQALIFAAAHKVEDRKLSFVALHNILLFRVEYGDFREARKQLFEMRPLYAQYAGAVDSVKLRGIEARIAAGLGDYERAEKGLMRVQEEFNKRGQVYHAAMMGLEVAALWLQKGRLQEVKQLVAGLLDVFRSRHVARETIAALLMLREALERDRVSQELIRGVARLIELYQDDDAAQLSPERDRAPRN